MTDIVDWLRRFKTLLIKSDASKPEGVAVARIAEAADEIERLVKALEEIAKQELSADMSVDDQLGGDFEGAYDHLIELARAALRSHRGE